ncbi:MAG: tetratricopeptide repeat protein [Syntrophobacteraceae bacterium]|nr:tetratricopeptide repeat protein [Syntrophobacteraceae bacterium]
MPMTSFARMNRSDHSMLPPAPAATVAYHSPNACNICHTDKDAAWADRQVREWRPRDYQAPLLHRASLIDAARKRDWSRREEMVHYITSPERDEIFAASLIRLVPPTSEPKTCQALLKAASDPSPLVRAAAVESLAMIPSQQSLQAIVGATTDELRLVRIRAAAALSAYPDLKVGGEYGESIKKADAEHVTSLLARPDQWSSHYNLGNYYLNRGKLKEAISCYDRALRIEPRAVMVLVNGSIAYSRLGDLDRSEESLRKALRIAPENGAALFNMGLLKAELNDSRQAEMYLKAALKSDPRMAQAAYNLCVLLASDRPREGVVFCREAAGLRPDDPKYACALAFSLQQTGETAEAITALKAILEKYPDHQDARALLRHISATTQGP